MLIAYLERINPQKNEYRFYAIYFVDTLLGPAVMRAHGRKGAWARVLPPVFFPDLEAAEPYIRHLIRRRLRRGYHPRTLKLPPREHGIRSCLDSEM